MKPYALILAIVLAGCSGLVHENISPDRPFRIIRSAVAPWKPDDRMHGAREWIGAMVVFSGRVARGPGALSCDNARLEATRLPPEVLFQGNLPPPAEKAMQVLGMAGTDVPGFRLICDTGVFEFHQVDDYTLLLGLDNRIFTLSQAPGALAPRMATQNPPLVAT